MTGCGIILALVGLTACQSRVVDENSPFADKTVRLGDTVVAEVDGTRIYLSDVEHRALAEGKTPKNTHLSPKDPVFQSVLDELIDQRLLALEALRQSLDQNDETRRRMAMARERILADELVKTLLSESLTDENVKKLYEEQRRHQSKGTQIRARQIIVADKKQAQDLKALLEHGGDFAKLAQQYSLDQNTADLGGDLGYFTQNSIAKPIAKHVFSLEIGAVSEPFKTSQGWHIIRLEDKRPIPRPSFKTVKPKLIKLMGYEEVQKTLKTLRAKSTIKLNTAANIPNTHTEEPHNEP